MSKRFRPGRLGPWRRLPAEPVEVQRFVRALKVTAEPFRHTAGRLAPALGQTRLLVPLTLFLRQEYAQAEIVSILLRLQALQTLYRDGALAAWAGPDPTDEALLAVHPAAVAAAATLPLDAADRFEAAAFLRRVTHLATAMDDGGPIKVPAP